MVRSPTHCGSSSSEHLTGFARKRERDRLNQRNKRQRGREQIATLEERIRHLEQDLQNATAHQRAGSQGHTSTQIYHDDAYGPSVYDALGGTSCLITALSTSTSPSTDGLQQDTPTAQSVAMSRRNSSDLVVTLPLAPLNKMLALPEWLRLPLLTFSPLSNPSHLIQSEKFKTVLERLRKTPNIAMSLPATPKVLDILFGGSRNELSNLLHSAMAPYPILPPEKFAFGWLLYVYFRWFIAPSQETYLAIPKHMRPTPCQFFLEHPVYIVAILWPSLRDRLVLHWSKYNLENVFGLLSCTVRIRASFNGNFIRRENDGEPQVDQTFYERFIREDGWGILERFWTEYPGLVDGVERSIMLREEHLMPA